MKTVKFILPVVAIMAAVAGVFATGNSAPATTLVDVSAQNVNSFCIKDGTCDTDITTKLCKLASGTILRQKVSGDCNDTVISVGAFVADQPSNP